MNRERKLDLRTPVGDDFGVVTALMQVTAEMNGVGLHAAEGRRELGEDQQEAERISGYRRPQ
jgi:hypothetical protein